MDSATRSELNRIASDLQLIINELSEIAHGLRSDFQNIGNERCAQAIEAARDKYTSVRNDVNRIH
jgi:hypothetical protein